MKRLALMSTLAACGSSAPADPSWVEDVQPILAANCVRCHRDPASGAAPTSFRLDVFEDTFRGPQRIRGAASMAQFSAARVDDMPPIGPPLDGRQQDILRNWASKVPNPVRGERSGNRPPTATLQGSLGNADASVAVAFVVDDPDGDPVVGQLFLDGDTVASLHTGLNTTTLDTTILPPGLYPVTAQLFDGPPEQAVTVALGNVTVTHNGVGVAPRVRFDAPQGEDVLVADGQPLDVRLHLAQPGGVNVFVTLVAFRSDATIPIGPAERTVPLTAGEADLAVSWDATTVPEGTTWRLRATVTNEFDPSPPTVVVTAPIIVSHGTTTDRYADIQSILAVCAECHNNVTVASTDFGAYDDANGVQGIFSLRGRAWRRLVEQREMPPKSYRIIYPEDLPFSAADRARLGAWLYAGAPR